MADLEDMTPVYDERTSKDVCALPAREVRTNYPHACCASCAFIRTYEEDDVTGAKPSQTFWECHRFAPRPITGNGSPVAKWPKVTPLEWCGDYKLKGS